MATKKGKKEFKVPEGYAVAKPNERGNVIAEGEVTGHAHVIDPSRTKLHRKENEPTMFLEIEGKEEVLLKHEEHQKRHTDKGPTTLPPGGYASGIARTYTEDERGWAPVAD